MSQELEKVVLKTSLKSFFSNLAPFICFPILVFVPFPKDADGYLVAFTISGMTCVALAIAYFAASRTKIEIGMEGVLFQSIEGMKTLSWEEIEGSELEDGRINLAGHFVFATSDGTTQRLRIDGMKAAYVIEQIQAFKIKRNQFINSPAS